jgi:branched-chain amino acid transport system ATP-binding protein
VRAEPAGRGERLLEAEGLHKSFGGLMAVNGVDFFLEEGEILGLVGPNGSGKTTLFNLVSGVFRPDRGAIRFDGREITGATTATICGMGIARTFQITRPFPSLTVLENVTLGRAYGSAPARTLGQAETEAREILELIGLAPKRSVVAGSLGLIDRKRLELGKALATRPKLLLLDEIMAGLNPTEIQAAIGLIRRIRASGVSLVVIEHMMRAMLGISDRLIVLNMGEKIAEGPPQEVLRERQVVEAYLGSDDDALH